MMNKKLLLSVSLAFFGVVAFAQTIVSTTAENKKVILEEFTGINCVFCPDGHAIANSIQDANEGDVFLINIHQGGFANPSGGQPDFRTPFGDAIANQTGLGGYPSGTINRTVFSGGNTALGRGSWTSAANTTLGQSSYLNMATEAVIDVQTNELTVLVEMFYTGDSPEATNKLNVALLQNNTLGPQTGGGAGNEYLHEHRLVHLVTGQWGEDISTTSTGDFVERTYTYTIPADYNGIPTELADMEVVVFATETTQDIISGNAALPTYSGITTSNDANAREIEEILNQCTSTLTPTVRIQNLGSDPITSLDIEYTINGGDAETFTWTGELLSLRTETVELPETAYDLQANNTIVVSLPDDENNDNNSISQDFEQAPEASEGLLTLTINTDGFGSEVRWRVRENGVVIRAGGNYPNNTTVVEEIDLGEEAGCYTFEIADTFGDGGGPVMLEDADGLLLYSTNGAYGSGELSNFGKRGILGVEDNSLTAAVMYPNPANNVLFIKNAENASIQVFDVLGKLLITQNEISANQEISVADLATGTYFVRMTIGNATSTQKLVVNK